MRRFMIVAALSLCSLSSCSDGEKQIEQRAHQAGGEQSVGAPATNVEPGAQENAGNAPAPVPAKRGLFGEEVKSYGSFSSNYPPDSLLEYEIPVGGRMASDKVSFGYVLSPEGYHIPHFRLKDGKLMQMSGFSGGPPIEYYLPPDAVIRKKPLEPGSAPLPATVPFDAQVKLPGEPSDVTVGGGGRYLLLSLRDQQSVGVFDVREAKLVKYVNVGMTDFLVAGGATEFVVSSLDGSLAAWKYDALNQPRIKAKLPMQGRFRVQAIALGYSSDGPLGISSAYNITNEHCIELYDLATLESAKIAIDWNGGGRITNLDRFELAATPDGQSFTCLQGTAVSGLDLKGATAVARAEQTLPATPNDNDRWYIGLDGRTVFRRETLVLPDGRTVAASHGAAGQYSLSLPGHVWVASGQQTRGLIFPVSFYLRNSSNPLTTIAFGNQGPQSGLAGRAFPSPKRVFYNGIEKTLAILPPGRKELCFKRYDLDEAIAKLDAVVLDVASQSSTTFQPAAKFEHKIEAVSNRGGLTYRLESGPKGMMISSDGRIEWSAPIDAPSVQTAIVTITDRTGKSIFHNLTLERGPTATVEVALTGGAVNPAAVRVALRLPAPADDFVVGAGGRYLLAPMNAKRQIAVIDVKERKLVKLLPTDDEVKVAAGATRFVVYTAKGELSRWNFDRLERESAESFAGPVESLCLGSASEGPLLLSVGTPGSCRATFVDLATLKPLKIDIYSSLHGTPDPAIDELTAASADGRTFTSWRKGEGVKGVNSYVVRGDRAEAFKRQESGGAVTPSPDGSTLYTLLGSYPSRQSQAAIDAARRHHVGWPARMSLPAATGNFILSWPSPHETKERDVELFTQGTRTPILKIAGLPRPSMAMNFDDPDPLYSRRLLYVPAADAILSIGPGRESVIIHRFALDDALSKWKPDYLFVTSLPPTEAQPSTQLSYQVVVRSAKGGLKYELPMAPRGASVSPSGLITWDIGPILNTAYDFGVRIVDSAGGETSQVFRVQVGPISNAGGVPVAALPGPGRSGSRPTGRPLPAQPFPDPRGPGADFPVPPGSQPPMVSSPPNVAAAPAAATAVPATARPATTIEFPAPVERLIAGGGGRYLVGFIETLRQIVVVDVVERKVVKYIPVDEEEVLLAVGATRFVALLGKKGTLQRYTLSTGEREQTGAAPSEKIVGLAMGSASEGPIIAVDLVDDPLTKVRLIDLNSLKAANDVKIEPDEIDFDREVAVSADGAFFVKGDSTGRISGSHIQVSELDWRHGSLGNALPSADGRVVYGLGGQYIVGSPSRDQKRLPAYFIPAVVGPLYARIPTPTSRLGDMVPVIGMQGESQPVLRLADLDLNAGETRRNGDVYNSVMAERFFLIPTVDTIAALGPDLNRLKLYRFNIDEEFAKVPDGFLFVASIAPGLVHPTSGMAYQLDVRSKQGGVKYRLDSGPPGMKVSDTGLLTWTAAGPDSSEKVVIVALSDASGTVERATEDAPPFVRAPKALADSAPADRPGASVRFAELKLEPGRELHAKGIYLHDDRWLAYLLGSSNFTRAGLGLAGPKNLEANLVYLVDYATNDVLGATIDKAFPPSEPLEIDDSVGWQPAANEDEPVPSEFIELPASFGAAILDLDADGKPILRLVVGVDAPTGWQAYVDADDGAAAEFIVAAEATAVRNERDEIVVPWTGARAPSGLWVAWSETDARAWWPINIANAAVLPTPDDLRDLPLELLIEILTAARPLHRVMAEYLKRKKKGTGAGRGGEIDPHKKVDTSGFLLQRTRRVSAALAGLSAVLSRPVATEESLHWRLYGPTGARAVAQAILKDAEENGYGAMKGFLLAELALVLSQCEPTTAVGFLPVDRIKVEIARLTLELREEGCLLDDGAPDNLRRYIGDAFAKASSPANRS